MTHKKTIFKTSLFALALCLTMPAAAKDKTITSPNGQLVVTLSDTDGKPTYTITLNGKEVMQPSRLGFVADFGDLTHSMTLTEAAVMAPSRTITEYMNHAASKTSPL